MDDQASIRWRDRHDPHAAPRRHPKGAFILDGGADRTRLVDVAARCARAGRSTTSSGTRRRARSTPAAARRGSARRSSGATTSATTWTHSSEGLTYGDDGAEDPDGLERHAGPRLDLRRRRAGRPVPERRRRRDLVARRRPARPPEPPDPGWSPGAGGLILHTIVPHPTDADRMWVAICAVGTFETEDGGATWEPRNKGVRADFNPGPAPGDRASASTSSCMAAGEPETPLPAEPLRRLPLGRRRADLGRDRHRPAVASSASSMAPIRATRRRSG